MDGRTDTEGYNIIPRHTLVAGYKKDKSIVKLKPCNTSLKFREDYRILFSRIECFME